VCQASPHLKNSHKGQFSGERRQEPILPPNINGSKEKGGSVPVFCNHKGEVPSPRKEEAGIGHDIELFTKEKERSPGKGRGNKSEGKGYS